jgi:hypothetical protein
MPFSSRVFLALSCTNKVRNGSGLILRSLIHFELTQVQGDRHESSFSFLQADNHFSQQHLLKRLSFLHHMSLTSLSKIKWAQLCEFISGSNILFHWSSCLFLCQYHAVFTAMALQYSLKSGIVMLPALLFAEYCLSYSWSFGFPNEL